MAEPIPVAPVVPVVASPKVESKPAETPQVEAAKATPAVVPAVEEKVKSTTEVKSEVKPAAELKTLLDEADEKEEEVKTSDKASLPEKYEFKLPEGITLDEAQMKVVDPIFRELGLSNEQAQKLVDLQFALNKQNEENHVKAFDTYVEGLKTQTKDYFGQRLPEVMRNVARVRDTFMPKTTDGKDHPLQEKLNVSGLANDKDFLEFFDRIGRTIAEGKFIDGKRSGPAKGQVGVTTPTGKDISLNEIYPSMSQK